MPLFLFVLTKGRHAFSLPSYEPACRSSTIPNCLQSILEALVKFDKIKSATRVGGMLLMPEFHANTYRIEALIHELIAKCSGNQIPSSGDIKYWLNEYPPIGNAAVQEDPPEDTFIARTVTPWGNFKVYGGIWEGYAFYLQLVLSVIEPIPASMGSDVLFRSIRSLLTLSDQIASRNKTRLYTVSAPTDKQLISPPVLHELEKRERTLRFSKEDLKDIGIAIHDLEPFILATSKYKNVLKEEGLTDLIAQPIVQDGKDIVVILPTAITWAIRLYIFDWLRHRKLAEKFNINFVSNCINFLKDLPIYGNYIRPDPVKFNDSHLLETTVEMEPDRYLHIIVVIDSLKGMKRNLNVERKKSEAQSDEVGKRIRAARDHFVKQPNFKQGLSMCILMGFGRSSFLGLNPPEEGDWDVCALPADHLETMVWTPNTDKKTIWRFVSQQRQLERLNVELHNVNGFLNLYGWWKRNDHMLVPNNAPVGQSNKTMIVIPTGCLAAVRSRAWQAVDVRSERYIDGTFKQVRKKNLAPYFTEDEGSVLYASLRDLRQKQIIGCAITKRRVWWIGIARPLGSLDADMTFRMWDAFHNWLERIAIVIDREFSEKSHMPVLFEINVAALKTYPTQEEYPVGSQDEIAAYDINGDTITINFKQGYLYFLHNPKNISEAAVVQCMIEGFLVWAGITASDSLVNRLVKNIVRNDGARQIHAFNAKGFREMLRKTIDASYEIVDPGDLSIIRTGMGHFMATGKQFIEGKSACTKFMNALIDHVYGQLKAELKKYNRQELLTAVFTNIEGIAAERSQWDRTMKAIVDLRTNKESVFAGKAKHFGQLSSADISCRMLVEIGLCESPVSEGVAPDSFELCKLMAYATMIFHLGNISDGIEKGEITPEILVANNGDVKTDQAFRESVYSKMIGHYEDINTLESIKSYEKNFVAPPEYESAKKALEEQFLTAFKAEFGATVDEIRAFLETIEDIGYAREQLTFVVRESEILDQASVTGLISEASTRALLRSFALIPRDRWDVAPEGFIGRDIFPWLFRRRLSLLLKPVVMIEESDNPPYLIAPGFIQDSIIYTLDLYRKCGMEEDRCRSQEMKRWVGEERVRRGDRFNEEAAQVIRELGYEVKTETEPKTIFNQDVLDRDYGDYDIIAWKAGGPKVFLIECKNLLVAKTFKEVAEQMQEFKGVVRNGKDDRLKKHIERFRLASNNPVDLAKFCKLQEPIELIPMVLFSFPVPVLYDKPVADVRFTFLDEIKEKGLD